MKKSLPVLTALTFLLSLILYTSGGFDYFELKAYDIYCRYLNPATTSDNIVIVKIDQHSLDERSKQGTNWPWPRQLYAAMVEYMSEADAIFIDILYTQSSFYGVEDDKLFADAVKKADNVYIAMFLSESPPNQISEAEEALIRRIEIRDNATVFSTFNSMVPQIEELMEAVRGGGNVSISPDSDSIYRKIPLFFKLRGHTIPYFTLGFLIDKKVAAIADGRLIVKGKEVPGISPYLRYSTHKDPYPSISAEEILQSHLAASQSEKPAIDKDFFKGKAVFMGLTAAGLYDLKSTPVTTISTGINIHAAAFDNIINGRFIRKLDKIYVCLPMFILCLFAVTSVLRRHSLLSNIGALAASVVVITAVTAILFKNAIYLEVIPLLAADITSFIAALAYSYASEGKKRQFLKTVFTQYMDKKIADHILKNPELLKPGGNTMDVVVYFADIAGFTTISEMQTAQETAIMLHGVMSELTEVIIGYGGVVDKYIGDCIMAFWGAPVVSESDETNSCSAAVNCLKALDKVNNEFKSKGFPNISLRIGMHKGDAIAGNMGSNRLYNFTVIGDTVNLASRLESVNKYFKTKIIVSEDVLAGTNDLFLSRELALIEVKGKSIPVKIFEVMGFVDGADDDKRVLAGRYKEAMHLFKEGKWQESAEKLEEILSLYPADGPSGVLLKRVKNLLAAPTLKDDLTKDWIIVKMTEK
ncbi:CHASE2 domain-containing protein [Candidatus Magnetominusculus xianensis]|uniref:Adenylate cyclase n=1 Tax=Candidatus Magnetominusculus xianensis TaxID=1748249 RepID=A0ABR5SH96_9BACT|nr:adenylate/guanylate cyclase domain-containing protein [Candidatus Magnetominusculus xianensis]KWT91059.1 adenylate cyclase [Candidatus Magnetominusculus xianensis]MBF0403295.1 adenylate/guanylate cyclase domain-containing protein [Nitrospirota bacterium]